MKPYASKLRKKAEELLKKNNKAGAVLSEIDRITLIHELEVHRIELELQNKELIEAKEIAEAATDKYIELYDFAPACYFTLNRNGKIAGLNLMASQLIGKERERLINSSFGFFISDDTRDQFNTFFEEVLQSKKRKMCEVILTANNQTTKYIQLTGMVTENGDHCLLTAVDITGQKQAEIKLQESEEKYRLLHENSGIGIGYYKPDGTVISYNNLAAKRLNGIPEDFNGKSIYDIFSRQEAEFYHKRINMAVSSEIPVVYEDNITLPTGKYCFLSTFTKILDYKNNITGIQIISQDITERKNAEDEIKKLLGEKEIILKEVHHRIKNNMNTIIGLFSLQAAMEKDKKIVDALDDAKSRVQVMMILYEKLYNTTDTQSISINNYLTIMINEIISNFPNCSKIKTHLHIDDFIIASQQLIPIAIIINELITNMMKYAFNNRESGTVTLTAGVNGSHAIITIQDDGEGMPESINFQNSTGFGMELVSMLTEQIGGSISIERGEGTKFVLEFDI